MLARKVNRVTYNLPLRGLLSHFYSTKRIRGFINCNPLMQTKFYLCLLLVYLVPGVGEYYGRHLELAAKAMSKSPSNSMNLEDLVTEFELTVSNELNWLHLVWRLDPKLPVSLTRVPGPDWQVGQSHRLFWGWLELSEQ
jgi:hypothetical protein